MLRALVLFLLGPLFGEVLPGSTPILMFLDPHSSLYLVALYGSGAVLARELVRRRGLGWANLLILGAAYGVLEEGMVVTSWFNPFWADAATLGARGRALDTNWIWAVGLTAYHSVVSITIPTIVAERLFPSHARVPWLGRRGLVLTFLLLVASSIFGLFIFGFFLFKGVGYANPPGTYVNAVIIFIVLVVIGLRWQRASGAAIAGRPPSLWGLRIFAFLATVTWFVSEYILPGNTESALIPIGAILAICGLAAWRVDRLSRNPAWGPDHRFALACGVLGFFIALAPVVEFGPHPAEKIVTGMATFALATLVVLTILSQRHQRAEEVPQVAVTAG